MCLFALQPAMYHYSVDNSVEQWLHLELPALRFASSSGVLLANPVNAGRLPPVQATLEEI